MMASSPFWLVYNVLAGSYAGIIPECVITLSSLVGLFVYCQRRTRHTLRSMN